MTTLPLIGLHFILNCAAPAFAQPGQWQVAASTSVLLAADTTIVYQGAPVGLKADLAGSHTKDLIVVGVSEEEGRWFWTLLPLSTGTLSFIAHYQTQEGGTVTAPPVSLAVTMAELASDADISDIKGPLKARPPLWPWLLGALIVAAVWFAWKRWKSRLLVSGSILPTVAASPPEEIATQAIQVLRTSGLWENDQAAYYLRLTDILRIYLEARYGEPVTAMTSVEVARLVKARARDLQVGGEVRELLSRADLVKFAKAKPGAEEGPQDADVALSLIKATTPQDYTTKKEMP